MPKTPKYQTKATIKYREKNGLTQYNRSVPKEFVPELDSLLSDLRENFNRKKKEVNKEKQ